MCDEKITELDRTSCNFLVIPLDRVSHEFKMNELVFRQLEEKPTTTISSKDIVPLILSQQPGKIRNIDVETDRSLFTHRKKTTLKGINDKIKIAKTRYPVEKQAKSNYEPKKGFALLFWRNFTFANKRTEIFYLLTSQGSGRNVAARLDYAGTKLLGLTERRYLYHYSQELLFPYDYPETAGYEVCQKKQLMEKLSHYMKRPPSKRVNYQAIGTPCPFYHNWSLIGSAYDPTKSVLDVQNSDLKVFENLTDKKRILEIKDTFKGCLMLVAVKLTAVGEGAFSENDMIYLASENDVDSYKKEKRKNKYDLIELLKNDSKRAQFQKEGLDLDSEYEGVFQERVKKTELNKKFNDDVRTILEHGNKFSSQLLDNNLVFKMGKNNVTDVMTRKPIGYVMYSKIDCSIRKYAGKGFVTAEGFKEILKRDRLCLVKEKSGVKFFFCKVEELSYY